MTNEEVVRELLRCMNESDRPGMTALVSPSIEAYITVPGGGVDKVTDRDVFVSRIPTTEDLDAEGAVSITQVLPVDDEQVMAAVVVEMKRKGMSLLNFAGLLLRIRDGQICEYRMVEAQPDYSDEFWSA